MKVYYHHTYKECNEFYHQTETFDQVIRVEFEDKSNIDNGMWINIWFEKGSDFHNDQTSIEFDPRWDWFDVIQ